MKKRIDLSIIIVNYNTVKLLGECLSSIYKSITKSIVIEIILIDNNSTDSSVEYVQQNYPSVKIVVNNYNLGYSKANNKGIKISSGKYILLLNSDTEVRHNVLDELTIYMDAHPDVGAITCRVNLPDGKIDAACHRGFPTPWASFSYFIGLEKLFPNSNIFGQYHLGSRNINNPHEIDSPSGAFFLIRKAIIQNIGFLDENFFMYGEDLDLAYRIKNAGWKIIYYPYVSILHKKKQTGRVSENKEFRKIINYHFYRSMILFYQKHYQKKYGILLSMLILMLIKIKMRISAI